MSKLTYNKILAKLEHLDQYLAYLRELQGVNKNTFIGDYHFFGLAERYLQLSIEILLDVGKLIILSEGLRRPEDNQDIFVALHEKQIVSSPLAEQLIGIVGFRNILVHDYEKIDREIIYQKLQKNLDTFTNFRKEVLTKIK